MLCHREKSAYIVSSFLTRTSSGLQPLTVHWIGQVCQRRTCRCKISLMWQAAECTSHLECVLNNPCLVEGPINALQDECDHLQGTRERTLYTHLSDRCHMILSAICSRGPCMMVLYPMLCDHQPCAHLLMHAKRLHERRWPCGTRWRSEAAPKRILRHPREAVVAAQRGTRQLGKVRCAQHVQLSEAAPMY